MWKFLLFSPIQVIFTSMMMACLTISLTSVAYAQSSPESTDLPLSNTIQNFGGFSNSTSTSTNTTLSFDSFSNATNIIPNTTEVLRVNTDKSVYHYGETINLTLEDFNNGGKFMVTKFKNNYPGIVSPCGTEYAGFVFLPGTYSNITDYDQLTTKKSMSLNVLYGTPYQFIHCHNGYVNQITFVNMTENSNRANIQWTKPDGSKGIANPPLIGVFQINKVYGKNDVLKEISPGVTIPYRENMTLPVGNYTIIGFTMSGKIGHPVLIKIVNSTQQSITEMLPTNNFSYENSFKFLENISKNFSKLSTSFQFLSFTTISGIVLMITMRLKFHNKTTLLGSLFLIFILIANPMSSNLAYATYNIHQKGIVMVHMAGQYPTQATTEADFNGIKTDIGQFMYNGFTVQNNQYIVNPAIGNNFLWFQSVIGLELPSTNSNPKSCSTQDPTFTYSCVFPTTVHLTGNAQAWTDPDASSNCLTGWTLYMTNHECQYSDPHVNAITLNFGSDIYKINLNAYQEIYSDGTVYFDQKYMTCSTLSGCSQYTSLNSYHGSTIYGNSNSYYGNGGTNSLSSADLVGFCGDSFCNVDKYHVGGGIASFYEGTYATFWYMINSNANYDHDSSIYFTTGENNRNLLWWDSIAKNTVGSNTQFSDSVVHGCDLPNGDFWLLRYDCTIRENPVTTISVPGSIQVGDLNAPTLVTIPSGVTVSFNSIQDYLQVQGTSGILINPGGTIKAN